MNTPESELEGRLTGQSFSGSTNEKDLKEACKMAEGYANATGGIAVISDYVENMSYIYAGKFGNSLGLPKKSVGNSFLEKEVFDNVNEEDLLERHILELRFLSFIKNIEVESHTDYYQRCLLRFCSINDKSIPVMHSHRYLYCQADGTPTLGICTYLPIGNSTAERQNAIVRLSTGELIDNDDFGKNLLTKRQVQILELLAKGIGSKEIADMLNISTHTVNRHRQDIYLNLNAKNTSEAVRIGLKLHLI